MRAAIGPSAATLLFAGALLTSQPIHPQRPEGRIDGTPMNATDIAVRDYGARARDFARAPDDDRGDAAAINRAVEACCPGDRLVFEPGVYGLWEPIVIEGKRDLEIAGNGALLLLRGFDRSEGGPTFNAVKLLSSQNVTVRDTRNAAIFACAVEGLEISDNTVENCSFEPTGPDGEYALLLKNCADATVVDNAVPRTDRALKADNCQRLKISLPED